MNEITREVAEKVVSVVNAGLVSGLGRPEPGQMCVEAAVCYAMGLPHGDNPTCVSPALRRLKIGLNDCVWSSPQARAKGLRRLAVAQLGSAGVLDDREFARRVAEMTIRRVVPVGLRVAAKKNPAFADRLEAAAVRCEQEGTREASRHAREIASAAAYAAYAAASAADDASTTHSASAANAAASAAYAATTPNSCPAPAADAAAAAAASAANAAANAANAAANADRTRDRVLAEYAEWVVEILIEMDAPGCQWLDLVPREAA
jgi:hypothetical protein